MTIPYGVDYSCPHGYPPGECAETQCWLPELDSEPASFLDRLRAALVDDDELAKLPAPEPLIDGIVYLDSLVWIHGRPGHFKSFVALDQAACVGTGETWHGRPVKRGLALYVIAEGTAGMSLRVQAWKFAAGHPSTGIRFLPVPVQSSNGTEWDALVALAGELRPVLIVIDTQARVTVGRDENSARDMGEFVHAAERLRLATRACVEVVHHRGRNGEHMRGSTALEGAATTILSVEKVDDTTLKVTCDKQKDAAPFDPITLRAVPTLESIVLAETDDAVPANVAEVCGRALAAWRERFADEWVSLSALIKAEVFAERTFYRYRLQLIAAGIVEKSGEKAATRYRLVTHD